MSPKNTGKQFERLTRRIYELLAADEAYTSVEENVHLDSPDGPRQVDVVVRSQVCGHDILTIVECRDYSKNLDVTHVDGLHSKMQGVGAHNAVLVARKGFSGGARKKARRLGISLCTAHDSERGLAGVGLQVPVAFLDIRSVRISVELRVHLASGLRFNNMSMLQVGGQPIGDALALAIRSGEVQVDSLNEKLLWVPPAGPEGRVELRDELSRSHAVESSRIFYTLEGSYYLGRAGDLPGTVGWNNISKGESSVFIDSKDLGMDYSARFPAFSSLADIPVGAVCVFKDLSTMRIEMNDDSVRLGVSGPLSL